MLNYQDHIDYDIQYSSNDHKEKVVVQLNVHRAKQHRQNIQVDFFFFYFLFELFSFFFSVHRTTRIIKIESM